MAKGKNNGAPNAFLCNPISQWENADTLAEIDTNCHQGMILTEIRNLHGVTIEIFQLQEIQQHTEENLEYQ